MKIKPSIAWMAIEAPSLASFRFRIQKPYDLLSKDFTCSISNPHFFEGRDDFVKADYYVYHKHLSPDFEYAQAQWIKEQFNPQAKIVFDICDDHFDREMGPHYKRMAALADIVTTTNQRFAQRIKEVTGKKALVCFDPVNSVWGDFKGGRDNAVWFGHSSNLPYLQKQLKELISDIHTFSIYTNGSGNTDVHLGKVVYRPYWAGRVEDALRDFDFAILPQDDSKNETKFKSPNRVVDALNAGLAVVTNSKEVYGEFKDFIFLDKDLQKAFQKYKDCDPSVVASMVTKGQEYIKNNYNDERIKEQWLNVFQKTK